MKKLVLLLTFLLINSRNEYIYCDIKGNVKKPGVYQVKENSTINDVIKLAGGLKKSAYTDNINLSKKVVDEMVIYIFDEDYIEKLEKINNCKCHQTFKYIECEQTTTKITSEPITTTKTRTVTISPKTTIGTTNISSIKDSTTKVTDQYIKSTNKISTTRKDPITSNNSTTVSINTTTKALEIININTANIEELCILKGLGEKKANSIIEYRENNGLFNSIEEIMNVSGIGESTFEKIKEFIKV